MDLQGSCSTLIATSYSFPEAQIRAIIFVLRERARRDFFNRTATLSKPNLAENFWDPQ
jgi:hypothetical protein